MVVKPTSPLHGRCKHIKSLSTRIPRSKETSQRLLSGGGGRLQVEGLIFHLHITLGYLFVLVCRELLPPSNGISSLDAVNKEALILIKLRD